jgi:hypothetical protein
MTCKDCDKPIRTAATTGRLPERCPRHQAENTRRLTRDRVRRYRSRAKATAVA